MEVSQKDIPGSGRSLPPFARPLLWLGLAASLYAGARAGAYLAVRSAYALAGLPATAVVTRASPHLSIVRKPRPSRYLERYRGAYRLEFAGKVSEGEFDTGSFIGAEPVRISHGDTLPMRCLRFAPRACRPAASLGYGGLIAALALFPLSFLGAAVFVFLLKTRKL